eukprot:m.10614 g.10614  ORF g.10614 m.10614 type:complete len:318 (+) comp6640_c0_seq1:229-1182(+)
MELRIELFNKVAANLVEFLLGLVSDGKLGGNVLENVTVVALHMGEEFRLKIGHLRGLNALQISVGSREKNSNLILKGHWDILSLLKKLGKTETTVKKTLGGGIEIRTELSESSNLTVLRKLKLHATSDLLHCLVLGSGTDTRHGKTDVNCWTDTLVEKLSLEENLAVGNGNHVGWNVCGHITGLCLNDGKCGEGASTHGVGHFCCTLKKTGVEVEDITRVGLTTRRTAEQEGHLTVCDSLLGQIIKNNKSVLSIVTEVLSHGCSGVWGKVLEWSGIRGRGRDNDRVLEGFGVAKAVHKLGNSRALLTNSDVDAVKLL